MAELGSVSAVAGQNNIDTSSDIDFFAKLTPEQRAEFDAAVAQGALSVFTTLIWNQKDSKITVSPEGDVEYNP